MFTMAVRVVGGGHSEHSETSELTKLILDITNVLFQLDFPC